MQLHTHAQHGTARQGTRSVLTLGSPCAASVVLRRSKGYDATVAAAPATAPLAKDTTLLLLPAAAGQLPTKQWLVHVPFMQLL